MLRIIDQSEYEDFHIAVDGTTDKDAITLWQSENGLRNVNMVMLVSPAIVTETIKAIREAAADKGWEV